MPTKDLTFRLFGQDVTASASLAKLAAEGEATTKSFKSAFGKVPEVITLAGVAAAGVAVKMAGDFQESTTRLVTGAGESAKSLDMVKDGLLKMAPAVGSGPKALADAMFTVESAGFHGADGLKVMQAAAEGAKVGGADATVVANGLTTALTDYRFSASKSADITSKLVATVAAGKTNMQDLSGALSVVLPTASKAGLGLEQVLGAMATMTGEGISAQQSAQDLTSTIAALQNPTTVQTQTMAQMGLTSTDVAQSMGKKGLTGTMMDLSQAILDHMGPSGLVLQSSFNQSKLAAQSVQSMLQSMPTSLRKLAQEYLNGSITQKQWTAAMKGQPALVAGLGRQFTAAAKQANGFSERLKAGQGSAATFNAIMANMTGGQTGLATSLALTGKNMTTFQTNVKNITGATAEAHGHVKGWDETQKDFNTQIAKAGASVQVMAIKLGTALMPTIQGVVKGFSGAVGWITKNKTAFTVLAVSVGVVVGVMGTLVAITKAVEIATMAMKGAMLVAAAAQKIAAAATWVFNVALDANPIGAIVMAIAALVAGLVWFFTQTKLGKEIWSGFVKFLGDAWNWLWGTVLQPTIQILATVFNWLWNNVIKPVGEYMIADWKAIGATFAWLYDNIIKPVANFIGTAVTGMGEAFHITFNAIGLTIRETFNGVIGFVRDIFNDVIDVINGVIGSIDTVLAAGKVIGINLQIPKLPHFEAGGVMGHSGLAVVGERGPEIVRLNAGDHVYPNGQSPNGQYGVYIENFNAAGMSPYEVGREITWQSHVSF